LQFVDNHLQDVLEGRATEMMELREIASELCISHKHLTDTVQQETGNHPCHFYDMKILGHAKRLLTETSLPVAEIAMRLTYDPSNFSKFFKKFVGQTPGRFRRHASAK